MNKYIEIDADLLKDLEDSEEEKQETNEDPQSELKNGDYSEIYEEFNQIYGKNKRDYVDKEVKIILVVANNEFGDLKKETQY
jgi:hypothetical protein